MKTKRILAWCFLALGVLGIFGPPIWLFLPKIGLIASMREHGANVSGAVPQSAAADKVTETTVIVFLAWAGTATFGLILLITGGVLLLMSRPQPLGPPLPRLPPPPLGAPVYPPRPNVP